MPNGATDRAEALRPYVPRFLIEWLREDPDRRYSETDGTLAFVDISGFTKMCERLARRGKVGAEEVNDVLDDCFTELLSLAYEDGGGVLKWGGDAVLLLFTGTDHTARACRAAHRMRRRLREIGRRLHTSAGLVSLRMSVGIHSGAFHLFLVGERHRELVITGPAATRTVRMESIATAGEIALSPEAASLLDPGLVGAEKDGARLLRSEPAEIPLSGRSSPPSIESLDIASCLPLRVREHLLEGGGEAEHRHVAVAFLEFQGVDELLEREGPLSVWRALDHLIRGVQDAAHEHKVSFFETDISADGGKVMLVAGAPESSGNDEEQILRTARSIVERGGVLPVRIGVNAGHVFAGNFGPPYRRTYSIKGDAVNLAARVMGKATPGQVLATVPVVERSLTLFDTETLEPFIVKGKKHPVHACKIGPVLGAKARTGWLDLPLVGRDSEMHTLIEQVGSARAGRGRLVEIVGEPGIGKSRLVQELRSKAPDLDAIAVGCEPYESSTAYHPFRSLLRAALGIPSETEPGPAGIRLEAEVRAAAPDLLPWLPLLAVPVYAGVPPTPEVESLDVEFRKVRLERVVAELLTALLARPTLLIMEDVHWMDEPSADLLRHLASLVGQTPWLILVTRRDQPTGFLAPEGPVAATLRPSPLSSGQAAALATAASEEAPLAPHAIAALAERSGGNPLFLQELVTATSATKGLEALPDSIEALLTVQMDRLPAADRMMLRYASVLGASFDQRLLDAVVALERRADKDVWTRLADFLSVDSTGTFRFRHALIRDVAYEGLPYRRRREIHARVGETIELWAGQNREDQAEALSLHFYQAGRYVEAWEYSRVAGDRARGKYANVEAADFYRRALDAGRRLGQVAPDAVARVHEALGDVAERAGLYETAATAYRDARRLSAGDVVEVAALLLKEGLIRERAGRYSDAIGWYTRGLRILGGRTDAEALSTSARIRVWYASSRRQQGRFVESVDWCHRAIEDAQSSGERAALAHAYRMLDRLYTNLGRPERTRYRELALAAYERLGDLAGLSEVLNELGADAYYEGRWEEALALYRRSTEARRKTGDEVNAAHGTNNIAEILSDQGHLQEADPLFREVLRIWKAAGFRLGIAFATSNLGRVAARSGRHEEAQDLYRAALAGFRAKQAEWESLETQARMAESHLFAGETGAALDLVRGTVQRVEALGGLQVLRAMLHRLRGYALLGEDVEAAAAAFGESLWWAHSVDARFEVGLTLMAQAQLASLQGRDGSGLEAEARGILDSLGVVSLPEPPVRVPVGA